MALHEKWIWKPRGSYRQVRRNTLRDQLRFEREAHVRLIDALMLAGITLNELDERIQANRNKEPRR